MTPRLTRREKIRGWFLWKCMDFIGLKLEDIERTTLYRTNPANRNIIIDYFYYRQEKLWED